MTERRHTKVSETQLDAALHTITGAHEPVAGLTGRVMAAIDALETRKESLKPSKRLPIPVSLGTALPLKGVAIGTIVVVFAASILMWRAGHSPDAPHRSTIGTSVARHPSSPDRDAPPRLPVAGDRPQAHRADDRSSRRSHVDPHSFEGQAAVHVDRDVPTLSPLDRPEPLVFEGLRDAPMNVARLELEGLSIQPLEVDTLDRPGKE
jgi:hypothetical protein